MFLLLEYPMFRLRVRFHRSNIQNFKFLMSTNSLCGVSCTHYRLLKITRAYLFPASCGLRTLSSLGRFWGTTYRKAWISAAQASSLQCFPPILHQIAGLWCSFWWRHVLSPLMMLGQEIFGPNGAVFQVWNVVETVKVALFLQAPRPKANNMPSPDIIIWDPGMNRSNTTPKFPWDSI